MTPRRLHYPAPARCSHEVRGGWVSRPWTIADVREYLAAGGWFTKGRHHFADRRAARLAGVTND